MDLHSTASLTDEALNDLYHRRRNYGGPRNANDGKKSVKTMRLAPLAQSKSSHSLTRNPSDLSSPSLDSKASKDQNRSPLLLAKNHHSPSRDKKGSNTEDIHYLSHLKHKAAGLSGLSPYKSPDQVNGKVIDEEIKLNEDEEEEEEVQEDSHPLPPFQLHQKAQENHQQLNQRVEEMQYQLLQESNYLSSLMASVVQQYESLKALNQSIIVHRREIATKVNDINENYIQLFGNMLQEVMKIQRIKFKSQTKLLEDYRIENERVVQTYTIVIQNNERLQEEYAKLEQEKADVDNFNVSLLQQHEEIKRQNQALQLTNNALVVQNQQLHKLTDEVALLHSYKQKLKETEALLARKEDLIVSLTAKYQKELAEKNEMIAKYSEEVNYLKEINSKNSIFNNLDKLTFQYPRAESSTQTEVTEDGLWDTSQGWVLPISKTALARQRWRRAGSFARCPSCRGIGKYIISVQSLLKKCIYGLNSSIDMLTGEHKVIMVNSDRYLKWRIPDELVIFLNNLPITIQAKKPKSLLWTIQHLYMILHYKFISDEEDNRLQYVTQSFIEFIIEQLLRNTEHRYQAEVQMYELLISIKEYSIHHPLVTLVARCLSLVDGLVEEEKDAYFMELKKNEEALQRKKKKEFEHLSARERNKLLSEWKDQQQQHPAAKNNTSKKSASYFQHIINKQQANSKNDGNPAHQLVEREFEVTDFSLSKDILKIVLFTRHCCLAQPYEGVYCRQIAEVHREIHQERYSNHPTIKKVIEYEKRLKKLSQTFWKSKDGNADLDGGASVSRSYDFTDSYQSSTHQGKAKKEQKEVEDPFALPKHVICDVESGHYHHYVPLDRAIRVLHPFLAQLKAHQIISIFRVIEDHTKCLFPDGSVYLPSGLNTFIRSTLRLFLYALSDNGEDIPSWEMVRELYHHPSDAESFHLLQEYSIDPTSFQSESHPSQISHPQAVPGGKKKKAKKGEKQALPSSLPSINEESSKAFDSVNKVGEDEMISSPVAEGAASFDRVQLHEDLQKYILMTDLDFFLTIIAELIRYQLLSIEDRLRQIFDEGDVNHDNVLSFDEFKAIVCHVKPDFPDRTILKMFREALTQGPENKDCIGPDSFVNICKEYQLFDILDIEELKTKQLQALWKGKPGEEITEEPLSVYIDVNDAIEPIDPTATIESVMIPIPAVTPTPPPLKSKSKIPISQINNTIDSLLKEKTISQQTTSQMKKDTTSIPPTNMSEKEGVASKQQVSVPPPTLKTMEGMMISSAKLNEPLSKESSQKMMSILNQRKEQRLKEKGYQLGVFSEG